MRDYQLLVCLSNPLDLKFLRKYQSFIPGKWYMHTFVNDKRKNKKIKTQIDCSCNIVIHYTSFKN